MVDIANHEDSLRELSKTSLVNEATMVLCWSAAEAARYLELYKSYEHAGFAAIRGQQSTGYTDRLVDFVTVPRSLSRSDAVALVANFGSLRSAVNADAEQLASLGGWGAVKVKRWMSAVEEPFRARKAARRTTGDGAPGAVAAAAPPSCAPPGHAPAAPMPESAEKQFSLLGDDDDDDGDDDDDKEGEEEALLAAQEASRTEAESAPADDGAQDRINGGVAAALARLREGG